MASPIAISHRISSTHPCVFSFHMPITRRLSDASKETIYGHHQYHQQPSSAHSPHKQPHHPSQSHAPAIASPLTGRRNPPADTATATATATHPVAADSSVLIPAAMKVPATAANSTPCGQKENRLAMPSGPPVRPEDACLAEAAAAVAKPHVK